MVFYLVSGSLVLKGLDGDEGGGEGRKGRKGGGMDVQNKLFQKNL